MLYIASSIDDYLQKVLYLIKPNITHSHLYNNESKAKARKRKQGDNARGPFICFDSCQANERASCFALSYFADFCSLHFCQRFLDTYRYINFSLLSHEAVV